MSAVFNFFLNLFIIFDDIMFVKNYFRPKHGKMIILVSALLEN